MKLNPVFRDSAMKFPRLSNAFYDIGMVLVLCGGLAICGVVLGMIPSDPYGFSLALLAFLLGFVFYSVSILLSKLRKPPSAGDAGFVPPKSGLKLVD